MVTADNVLVRFKPIVQKKDLKRERPATHVVIKVREIRVVGDRLKMRRPPETSRKHLRKRGLARANIASYRYKNLSACQDAPQTCLFVIGRSPKRSQGGGDRKK